MPDRARLIGINHVALEVGDLKAALDLYSRLFDFELRGYSKTMAFLEMGDQFLAVSHGRAQPPDDHRHFGLVVEGEGKVRAAVDEEKVRAAVAEAGLEHHRSMGGGVRFKDPWGNNFEVVAYQRIQFERAPGVKRVLGIEALEKNDSARREIAEKGMD
jgi:catechol 2,3-dioxygenase-like lactoylglutathione lyase family enzyme